MKEHAASAGPRYLDPLSDAGFMQVFGNEAYKEIVIDFLNALLKGKEVIRDVQYIPVASRSLNGELLLDLLCTDDQNSHFLVHLQRSEQETPDGSLMFHGARLIVKQPKEVKENGLKRVYCIGLMNFHFHLNKEFECIQDTRFILKIGTRADGPLYDVSLTIKLVEVPLFTKPENELGSDLDKWLFLLKNLGEMKEIPGSLKRAAFENVFQAAMA